MKLSKLLLSAALIVGGVNIINSGNLIANGTSNNRVNVEARGELQFDKIGAWGGYAGYNLNIKINSSNVKSGDYIDIKFKNLTGRFLESTLNGHDIRDSGDIIVGRSSYVGGVDNQSKNSSSFNTDNKDKSPMNNWTIDDFSMEKIFRITFNENVVNSDSVSINLGSSNIYNSHPWFSSTPQKYVAEMYVNDNKIASKEVRTLAMPVKGSAFHYGFSGGVIRYSTNTKGDITWMESSNISGNILEQFLPKDKRFEAGDVFTFEFTDDDPLWKVVPNLPIGSHQSGSCDGSSLFLTGYNLGNNSNNNNLLMSPKNGCLKYRITELSDKKFKLVVDYADGDNIILNNPFFITAFDNAKASILNPDGSISVKPVKFRSEILSSSGSRKWYREELLPIAIEKQGRIIEGRTIFIEKQKTETNRNIETTPAQPQPQQSTEIKAPNTGFSGQAFALLVISIMLAISTISIFTIKK